MIVIAYSFNLISFIQTFQWIREFNTAKAGLFEVKQVGKMDIKIPLSYFFLYLFNLKQDEK